jgi:copper chaperone CopZ
MTCGHCVGRVDKALLAMEGVTGVDVNLDEKMATVTLEKEVPDENFKSEIENNGYKVVGIESVE